MKSPWICCVILLAIADLAWGARPRVELVTGPNPPKLEQLAARELADQLKRLFDAETIIVTAPTNAEHTILLGSPSTNPVTREVIGSHWPALSEQGHLLRTIKQADRTMLVIGGGSPQATLWAAYEFGHQLGIRALLQGDFLPVQKRPFSLAEFNLVLEPSVRVRAWQTLDGGPIGWEGWGIEDHRRVLRQLAKQKINRIVLSLGPDQPFLDFTAAGVKKTSGFFGKKFVVDGDTAGRKAFRGARVFENPDCADQGTYESRLKCGTALVHGIVDAAHELGMSTGINLAPLEFPAGIAAVLQGASEKQLLAAAEAQLLACLKQYPQADALYLVLPSDRKLALVAATEWNRLLKGIQSDSKRAFEVHFVVADGGLLPALNEALPNDTGVVLVDLPSGSSTSESLPHKQIEIRLFDDAVGVLPQVALARLQPLAALVRQQKPDGWIIRTRVPSDVELSTYFLARYPFDPAATPDATTNEVITTIAGEGVADRLRKGFEMVDKAAQLITKHDRTFAVPGATIVTQHAQPTEPAPKWWAEVRELYTEAMNEMYRGNTRAREGGRGFILYNARRFEFGLTYISSLESVRQASVAKSKGDIEGQVASLEGAVEGMYNALGAFSEVARDQSDRGLIAVLNEFAYRPLAEQLKAIESNP